MLSKRSRGVTTYAPCNALTLNRAEISGAFAHLGLLVPLEGALVAGWHFRMPMPVQPLAALAA